MDPGLNSPVAAGFWGPGRERTFIDIRIFNLYAPSNKNSSLSSTYKQYEKEKRRHDGQRITEIEHGSFSPLVFSSTGGMAKETTIFYKKLASLLSNKWDQPYSVTMGWLRCTLGFSLLKSSIQCIRGVRSTQGHAVYSAPRPSIDVIHSECQIS